MHFDVERQVRLGQHAVGLLRPLDELESDAGEYLAKPGVFPLGRVVETVEVEVPDRQRRVAGGRVSDRIRLDHRIGRALDAPLHAQGLQQVAHETGLSGAQITVQFNDAIRQFRLRRQGCCKQPGRGFILPAQAFYNRRVDNTRASIDQGQLVSRIECWGQELGFAHIGFSGIDLKDAEPGLLAWLKQGFHGDMAYMEAHGLKRARPAELVPGTVTVLTARLDYLTTANCNDDPSWQAVEFERLHRATEGVISLYARGRDYHKVLRQRLARLAERIAQEVGEMGYRVFTDSAPVLEVALAERSGQGWRGKHTLVLNREGGSMFFLGEIYLDMALPPSAPVSDHCGNCKACIEVCPTGAIVAPYRLDARRCISYLTIEHHGAIPLELRPLIGNRIYGCDDCQLACPWNKFAQVSPVSDFAPRAGLVGADLVDLFGWSEAEFLQRLEGSPIRRIGHERWLRNIAVAMGNALAKAPDLRIEQALRARADDPSALVREHVAWALGYHRPTDSNG